MKISWIMGECQVKGPTGKKRKTPTVDVPDLVSWV